MRPGGTGRCVVGAVALLSALGRSAPATARPDGPDLIVGDIPSAVHYTTAGPIDGKRAYAIATTACNIGDRPLAWVSSTSRHPVITQNLYRLSNGRFEQIGQAWLKHAFCALQGTVCGTCPVPLDCSALGVQCSDPYSASLNGQQSGMGPKYQVNPVTGAFPYPFDPGNGSGPLFKRLQADQKDLANPGALYFVASMYVHPDDAAADNAANNESYRRVEVDPSSYSLMLRDSTHEGRPALLAWADNDPGVTVTYVDVPGDGRFIVGARATRVGGVWRYEYAVQNFDSERAGQAFGVPLPPAAQAANLGFHDVDYHSGEPFDGTDWSASAGPGGVTWACAPYAEAVNANALRWDTVYNFRFDTTAAPGKGAATLVLFKPGGPGSVPVETIVPSIGGGPFPLGGLAALDGSLIEGTPAPTGPPPNDGCADRLVIGLGDTSFSTLGATTDGPGDALCSGRGSDQVTGDIWFVGSSRVDLQACKLEYSIVSPK